MGIKDLWTHFSYCDLTYARKVCPNIEIPFTHPAVHLWKPISHVAYIEFDVKSPATKWMVLGKSKLFAPSCIVFAPMLLMVFVTSISNTGVSAGINCWQIYIVKSFSTHISETKEATGNPLVSKRPTDWPNGWGGAHTGSKLPLGLNSDDFSFLLMV